ncbi:MAG: phage virion morphogenesis protein [Bacteroidota bacterium]
MSVIIADHRGFDEAILVVSGLGHVPHNQLLAVLAETVRKQTLRRFATKTAPSGAAWAPKKRPDGYGLLVRTGRMRNSIASRISGMTAEIGTNVHYAKYHQFGTRKMVARPFMGINPADAIELQRVAERFLAAGLGGAGSRV